MTALSLATQTAPVPHRPPLVAFSVGEWDGIWRPRREYIELLARRGWPCLYTTGLMPSWDLRRGGWKGVPLWDSMDRAGSVMVNRRGALPFCRPGLSGCGRALRWHGRRIRAALDVQGDEELIALLFDPIFWPYVEALRPRYVVYYQYDPFSLMGGWGQIEEEFQRRLVERADLIVSVTRSLADTLPGTGPARARLLPNAARIELFEKGRNLPCPPDLARIPRPRIGYIGSITIALDFDLIEHIARARPDWHLMLIGPIERNRSVEFRDPALNERWRQLLSLPNIHYLPQVPGEAVPAYLAHLDVNALWYNMSGNGWWLHADPLKLYETLAVGKPIVSAGLKTVRGYTDVVDIPESPDQWVSSIARALDSGGVGTPESRMARSREHSWAKRAETLESWLFEMIGRRV